MDTSPLSFAAGLTGTTTRSRSRNGSRGWIVIPTVKRPWPRPMPLPNPDDAPAPVPKDD